ncbi:MAG: hypothetical protein HY929_06905 [Euryarchaeota archaeon]|nr:hypothetical protein [Euryarchaeota archaeon]
MAQKTHITLSIPKELYEEMKKHKEIKWSEVARKGIKEHLERLKSVTKGSELLKSMPPETRELIKEVSDLEWKRYYKTIKEKEWKRTKSLTQTSS